MTIIVADTLETLHRLRPPSQKIALVPTMGNLHKGHLYLVERALEHAEHVIVSIFVNRLQFAPHEDFDRYPRTLMNDCALLETLKQSGRITVFAPEEKILFPVPQNFHIQPPPMANTLEGYFRPGFFGGVCTIVMKLFQITAPHLAFFGQKDRQQLTLIRQMIEQFSLPIELIEAITIRGENKLALSSRNTYLTEQQLQQAPELYQTLEEVGEQIRKGDFIPTPHHYQMLEQKAQKDLSEKGWVVDYIAIRDTHTLNGYPATSQTPTVILGAAKLGQTRLIDNIDV
ncbi:MAG: pantoate--beta-alanine ligase [Pseudomonadota bacterium]